MLGSSSLRELYLARLREFTRQKARIFWVYGFPMVLAVGLGLAFKSPAAPSVLVDLVRPTSVSSPVGTLLDAKDGERVKDGEVEKVVIPGRDARPKLEIRLVSEAEGERRIKTGKAVLPVRPDQSGAARYQYAPTRPEASA